VLFLYRGFLNVNFRPHPISDVRLELGGILTELLYLLPDTVLCSILLLHGVLSCLQVQQIGHLLQWDSYTLLSLEVVALSIM